MPKKKSIRRFEPRYGVNQTMIEIEGKYVTREFEDHLLLSADDLSERLKQLRERYHQSDATAEFFVHSLSERESLAIQCLLVRDFYHLLELYNHCLAIMRPDRLEAPAPTPPLPAKRVELVEGEKKMVPFSEWLFDSA
jgi:hypothetical protein